jgi:hypothetical protein
MRYLSPCGYKLPTHHRLGYPLRDFGSIALELSRCVAQRQTWAAEESTVDPEDAAVAVTMVEDAEKQIQFLLEATAHLATCPGPH